MSNQNPHMMSQGSVLSKFTKLSKDYVVLSPQRAKEIEEVDIRVKSSQDGKSGGATSDSDEDEDESNSDEREIVESDDDEEEAKDKVQGEEDLSNRGKKKKKKAKTMGQKSRVSIGSLGQVGSPFRKTEDGLE